VGNLSVAGGILDREHPEFIERLGNDALAFENVDLNGDQIALLLRN
jgi:hypothetical protein